MKGLYFCIRATFLLLFAFFIHGCASFGGGLENEASLLQKRAGERWEALINKDWEAAYGYELPEYRKTHDVAKYKRRYGTSVQWKSVEITAVDIREDNTAAVVTGDMTYQFFTPGGTGELIQTTTTFRERWVKKGSEWWFVPSRGL